MEKVILLTTEVNPFQTTYSLSLIHHPALRCLEGVNMALLLGTNSHEQTLFAKLLIGSKEEIENLMLQDIDPRFFTYVPPPPSHHLIYNQSFRGIGDSEISLPIGPSEENNLEAYLCLVDVFKRISSGMSGKGELSMIIHSHRVHPLSCQVTVGLANEFSGHLKMRNIEKGVFFLNHSSQ